MVIVVSLFLWLITDVQTVELAVDPRVVAVRVVAQSADRARIRTESL